VVTDADPLIQVGTVLRRSRAHASAGLTANWMTDNDTFHLVDRANWMLTRPATWLQISNATDLPMMGGYRILVEWTCTAAAERPCPDGLAKTGCGRVHLQWDTPRRLDDEGTGWTGSLLVGGWHHEGDGTPGYWLACGSWCPTTRCFAPFGGDGSQAVVRARTGEPSAVRRVRERASRLRRPRGRPP
jgi:hypothetical protein